MKIHSVKIVLDKDVYHNGGNVTGRLIVKTSDPNWGSNGKVFLKLYDKLDVEWLEDEMVSVGITKRAYENKKKPFQLNLETFMDKQNANKLDNDNDDDYIFEYPFDFCLPVKLQGTLNVPNAKCNYFIKSYLSNDESVFKHYSNDANVFDELFKSLNHTYCKQEVIIQNKTHDVSLLNNKNYIIEAKSPHIKAIVTLPKKVYGKNETIPIHIVIEHADDDTHKSALNLHKISFKLFQLIKLQADVPIKRSRLFENLISHSSRKNVHQNAADSIELEEFIQIPKNIQNSSSRLVPEDQNDGIKTLVNPIRINYKLSLSFWKNFLVDELDLNVPLLIDPEV